MPTRGRVVVGVRNRRAADLPQVLAARGFDQPVDGVVGVVGARLDALVAEVDGLLGVVADVGDVARRVVGVVQVLHLAAGPAGRGRLRAVAGKGDGIAPGEQMHQAEGQRVVVVGGPGAVAVVDQRALALGVVVDVGDERRSVAGRRGSRRLASVHLLQQVGFVVDRLMTLTCRRCCRGAVRSAGSGG